ncbi:MAG: ABC-2 family transporter protein [Planctomycetota bacterium]
MSDIPNPKSQIPNWFSRYAKTLSRFWSAAIAVEAEYRINFVMAGITSAVTLAGAIGTLAVLYQHGYEMGGWSWNEAMLVVAVYTLLDGLQRAVMAPNRQAISQLVREGTLDFVLLKPVDAQFWLSVRRLSVWGLPDLVLGFGLVVYAGVQLGLGPGQFLAGVVPVALAIGILYALGYALATLTVWVTKADNITIAMQSLLEAGRYPVPAYAAAYRVALTFVVPVAFMTTVPAGVMTGRFGWGWVAAAACVAVGLLVGCRWFWRFALRSYTSASS